MSDTSDFSPSGASPASAILPRASCPPNPSSSLAEPGCAPYRPPETNNQRLAGARPLSVQPLSNEAVQTLSNGAVQPVRPIPVQPLSSENRDTGRTEGEQTANRHIEHTPDMAVGQGVNTPPGHGMNRASEQGENSQCEQALGSQDPVVEPLFILRRDMTNWTANQDKVLSFFRSCGHCVTNHKVVGEKLGIPYGTVRNIIRRLTNAGLLRTETYKNAGIQGIEVWYCGPDPLFSGNNHAVEPELQMPGLQQPLNTQFGQPDWTQGERPAYIEERKIEREKEHTEKNLSIWNISKEQIDQLWPSVGKAGLFASHLQEIREALQLQGIESQPDKIVAQSLRFLDWQLSSGPIIDQHGKEVQNPIAYWRASMKRHGCYQKPAGYIDPEELALRQLAEEENAKLAARRALHKAQAEQEKQARLEEVNAILQELAEQTADHPLWEKVSSEWSEYIRLEVQRNPQAIVSSPGTAATTRIILRKLLGWPDEKSADFP